MNASDESMRYGLERQLREVEYEIEKACERVLYLKRLRESVRDRLAEVPQ